MMNEVVPLVNHSRAVRTMIMKLLLAPQPTSVDGQAYKMETQS